MSARRAPPKPRRVEKDVVAGLRCIFFRTESGNEPVRDWLRDEVSAEARRTIGTDIHTVQATWPIGKPLVDGLGDGLFEVRSTYDRCEYRVMFVVDGGTMVLLHGFQKKTQRTRAADLDLARERRRLREHAR